MKINYKSRKSLSFQVAGLSLFLLIAFSCSNQGNKNNDVRSTLKIGIAQVNYTPAVGHNLVGNYRGDDYASRGIHDSLYAKALVAADDKGQKVAVLSIDICMLSKEPVDFMRNYIARRNQNQFTPPGDGVNKLIFKRIIYYSCPNTHFSNNLFS